MKFIRLMAVWIAAFGISGLATQSALAQTPEAAGLAGSSWLLTATSGQDHQTLVLPDSSITLNFEGKDRFNGNGGCNQYNGTYTLGDNGEITVSEVVSTKRACTDEQMTTQESIYLGALGSVTGYDLSEGQLTLRVGDLESLHFVRAAHDPLAGTSWRLINEVPDGAEATAEVDGVAHPITLTFDAAGQAAGNGGCNSYSGTYTRTGTSITFGNIVSTLMACEAGDIMEREQDFFAALAGASQYGLTDDRLYIRYGDGSRLAFEKVAAMTLTASQQSGAAGTEVELTGSGFAPNSEIVIAFGPAQGDVYEPIGQVISDADGAFTITVSVPTTADPAVDYVFMAAVPGTARTLSAPFDVTSG
ncbi:MAG: META domain-containing protein [Anaerolineae bacterium]|nr:META domain-containing protein [Anaerolineae bacterium]